VGPNSADITFRELLTHRAGFTDANYDGDYMTFKNQIKVGVAANPTANYTNGSFEISRDLSYEPFGEQIRRRARGRLNDGGAPITMTTVNGNIRVHPAAQQ